MPDGIAGLPAAVAGPDAPAGAASSWPQPVIRHTPRIPRAHAIDTRFRIEEAIRIEEVMPFS
jgi:hypothetical protein